MLVQEVQIRGLKGAPTEQAFGPLNLIQGPNGTGKTRLLDGILFACGQETAGVSPDGKNLAAAMEGEEISAKITICVGDGELVDLERTRRRSRGTFSRSKLFNNGLEIDSVERIIGPFNPRKGRAMVDMSPDALLVAVSQIGARCSEDAGPLLDALERAAMAYDKAWKPEGGPALDRLEVAVSEISDWRKRQKKAVREAESSREFSRKQLGAARVQPGASALMAERAEEAGEKEREASSRVGQSRAESASLSKQVAALRKKLSSAGTGGEDLASATTEAARVASELEEAKRVQEAAEKERRDKASSHDDLERSIQGTEDAIAELDSELSSRRAQAEHLSSAPCSKTTEWISIADQ